jgi:DNA polymerase-3 subunit beta
MHLNVEQKTLSTTLRRLASIVESRSTIPALQNAAMTAQGDTLTITVTDLDIEATATIPATVLTPGATTIPAKMLSDIVAKMPAGSLVSIKETDNRATVSAGRSSFTLATLPIEDFPALASASYATTMTQSAAALARLFSGLFAASTEETRYYLNGVYLHQAGGSITGVATDGHKLAHVQAEAVEPFPGVIVPRKTVAEVVKSFFDGDVVISISETKIRFAAPGFTLTSKVIDGTFPDYTRVIPPVSGSYATMQADDLRAAVDRVTTVSGEKTRTVVLDVSGDGELKVETIGPMNSAADYVACKNIGDGVRIGFNGGYLADIMKAAKGAIRMEYTTASNPVAIIADGGAKYILMPMRVNG